MLQKLTYIIYFYLQTDILHGFQENIFHKPEALLWSCDTSNKQNICVNENLDDKNGKPQLSLRVTGMLFSLEKLDICLQLLVFAIIEQRSLNQIYFHW